MNYTSRTLHALTDKEREKLRSLTLVGEGRGMSVLHTSSQPGIVKVSFLCCYHCNGIDL